MKKLVLTDFKKLEILEGDIPVPSPGEAVIRINYAGICGSDLHVYDGIHPSAKVPLIMGHEGAGELVALNDDRTDIKIGDKVCAHTIKPCNACEACVTGHENLCRNVKIMGTNFNGVFTQYMLVDSNRLIKFNNDVEYQLATLAEPLTVAVHDIRKSGLRAGDNVLIGGAGPIGLVIAIMAKYSGATHVVLTEIDSARIRLAKDLGFTVANPNEPNFDEICNENCDGEGFECVFEITAVESSFKTCLNYVKKGGVLIQVGMPPAGTTYEMSTDKVIYEECNIRGVRHHTMNDMQTAVKIINSGTLNQELKKLISAVYPINQAKEAFDRARNDKTALRVLIDFTKE